MKRIQKLLHQCTPWQFAIKSVLLILLVCGTSCSKKSKPSFGNWIECSNCKGTGYYAFKTCGTCNGTGWLPITINPSNNTENTTVTTNDDNSGDNPGGYTPYIEPSPYTIPEPTPEPIPPVKTWHDCRACYGNGLCHRCKGHGSFVDYGPLSITSKEPYEQLCDVCHGSGVCQGCDGRGGFEY